MKLKLLALIVVVFSEPVLAAQLVTFPFTSSLDATIIDSRVATATFTTTSNAYLGNDGAGNVLEFYPSISGGDAASAVASGAYFALSFTAAAGETLGFERLRFDAGPGGDSAPRGFVVRSSLDGFTTNLVSTQFPMTGYQEPTKFLVSLSGGFAAASDLELRFYVYTPSAGGNSVDFRNVTLNSVPEPATWGLMLVGFGLAGVTLRRKTMTVA